MLAMAGLAEAAIAVQIAVTWFGLILIGGLSAVAFSTRRTGMHATAIVLATLFGIMFVPWEIPFTSLTAEDRDDPDVVMWFGRYRFLAYACYLVMAAVLVNFIHFMVRKPVVQEPVTGKTPIENAR